HLSEPVGFGRCDFVKHQVATWLHRFEKMPSAQVRKPHHGTRKERMLRFAARRNTCAILALIGLFISCILLTASLIVFFEFVRPTKERLKVALNQRKLFSSYSGTPIFPGCTYKKAIYSTELCSHCDPSAYVLREWEVENENLLFGGQCWNKFETTNCSDEHMSCAQFEPGEVKQCAGFQGVGMGNLSFTQPNVMVPLIDLAERKGEILHVKEIFAVCPTCHIYSRSYRLNEGEKCRKRVLTVNNGWPETFELCDGSAETDDATCETYS
uniref:Uncharacterized protein n=1 Tax=Parascaris univalens TaxID=6257 RepID=A0A915AGD7_PARUN